jgi:aerobic C4-dicarboxylate transport protein
VRRASSVSSSPRCTFNLDGTSPYLATAAVFLAQALASKGAPGVAGAGFVVLAGTLAVVGAVPVESVALILGVHRLMSQALTPTNLIGNGVATLVIAKWEAALDRRRLQQGLSGKDLEQR